MLNKNIFCIKKVSLFLSMGIFIVKTFFFGYLCFINISFYISQMERKKILFIVNPISGTHSKENAPDWVQNTLDKNIFVP